jgi:N-acetylmuramoyl-L-alanine amidase
MKALLKIISDIKNQIPSYHYGRDSKIVPLIDPGHGGILDCVYTTAPSKMYVYPEFTFYEGVFNRALAWTYASKLNDLDLPYSIIVSEDDDITVPLRVERANNTMQYLSDHKFKCYYHSIHANAFKTHAASGIEVFTSPGKTKSDPIADIFYNHLSNMGWQMRADMIDGDKDKEAKFYVLTKTRMPAILTETGFYTNKEQAELMRQPITINVLADLFVAAHLQVIKQKLL